MRHITNIGCGLIVLALLRSLLPGFITDLNALFWMAGWLTCYVNGMILSRMCRRHYGPEDNPLHAGQDPTTGSAHRCLGEAV